MEIPIQTEIYGMPDGPQLDYLVAVHVMNMDHCEAQDFYPSVDSEHALRIIDRFRLDPEYDWTDFNVALCTDNGGDKIFLVDFDGGSGGRAQGNTLPLALCRAALVYTLYGRKK